MELISVVTFRANDVQRLFQVNQKKQYVGLFAKSKSTFKVRDLRYLNESRCRRDSLIHVASVLGILIDGWNILVSHSCLFVARGRIQSIMWRRNLQLEVKFDNSKTLRTKKFFYGGFDFHR
jgi:hypothetical protein